MATQLGAVFFYILAFLHSCVVLSNKIPLSLRKLKKNNTPEIERNKIKPTKSENYCKFSNLLEFLLPPYASCNFACDWFYYFSAFVRQFLGHNYDTQYRAFTRRISTQLGQITRHSYNAFTHAAYPVCWMSVTLTVQERSFHLFLIRSRRYKVSHIFMINDFITWIMVVREWY